MNDDPENPYRPFRDSTWDEPDRPRRDVSMEEAECMPMSEGELGGIEARLKPEPIRGDFVMRDGTRSNVYQPKPEVSADDCIALVAEVRRRGDLTEKMARWVDDLRDELRQVRQEWANLKQMLSQCEGDANRMQALIGRLHGLLEGGLTYNQSELRQDALEMLGLDEE